MKMRLGTNEKIQNSVSIKFVDFAIVYCVRGKESNSGLPVGH